MADIVVNISRRTGSVTQKGFGLPFILATNIDKEYKEYSSINTVAEDYKEDTVAYKMANALFSQEFKPQKIAIVGKAFDINSDTPDDLVAFLNEVINKDNDWYFLLCDISTPAVIKVLSSWINTQDKMYVTRTNLLPSIFKIEINSERTSIYYHKADDEYLDAATVGQCAPKKAGSLTWKNQLVKGVTPNSLSTTEFGEIRKTRWNTVVRSYGQVVTSDGYCTATLFIDQRRSQDFVKYRIQENLAALLIFNDKIPYDDRGISQVVSTVESALNLAFNNGIIATKADGKTPMFEVKAKTREEIANINPQAINNRVLEDLTFSYVEAGAIEKTFITGQIVMNL